MNSQVGLTLGLLPEPGTRWGRFVVSYGAQSLVITLFVIMAIAHPEIMVMPVHDYHLIGLVNTPPPVPQEPAPIVRNLPTPPPPKVAEIVTPRPQALRVPAELVPPKKEPVAEIQPPKVTLAASKALIPDAKPFIPRQPVKTNVFSNGSSATPTIAAAPSKVQTGGFGDPNGVPAQDGHGKPVTIAAAGSFDLPGGPGYGNGTGGSHGVRGVVASAGFGNGVATSDGVVSASRGSVKQGAFGDADVVSNTTPRPQAAEPAVKTVPAEITFKPRPVYTDEGRQLKVEGEVLIDVVFAADGQIKVVKVVRGLGHGLDESAVRAAEKIQFKPALKDGRPADFEAVVHVVFQLAS